MMTSTRIFCAAALCCAVAPAQSLRELADQKGIRVGTAVAPNRLGEELYATTLAREADPKALLFYNDYSAETINAKSDAIYNMVQDFKSRAVPIDGVGLQMHLTAKGIPMAGLEANISRLTGLGLQVQIAEFDMRLPVDASGVATPELLAKEAEVYRDITSLCLKNPTCTAIQIWGFTDKYSWIPRTYPGTGAALLFDTSYQPKPSYEAMKLALQAK